MNEQDSFFRIIKIKKAPLKSRAKYCVAFIKAIEKLSYYYSTTAVPSLKFNLII